MKFFLLLALVVSSWIFAEEKPALVFDFGGVIAHGDRTEWMQFLKNTFSISDEELKQQLKLLRVDLKQGKSEEQFWEKYAASLGKTLNKEWFEQLDKVKMNSIHEDPKMIALVKDLHRKGYVTAMLSNISSYQMEIIRKKGLYDYFDPVILSCQIGVEKPSPKAYKILLKALNLPPSDCIFIDDKPENIQAAKALGIDGIQFQSYDQLLKELQKRGIEEKAATVSEHKIDADKEINHFLAI